MSKNNDVFELVKSLSKNEKRFFKLFSKRHSDNEELKYLQLFDIYDSFIVYDKKNIDQEISNKNISNIRNIKHQLNLQILRCLNTYHYNKNKEIEASNHLQNSQILFEKGLFNHAYKSVNQAKMIAKKYDLKLLHLDCLKKEKQIARELYIKEVIEYYAKDGLNDEKTLLNQYIKTCENLHLRNQLILLGREANNLTKEELTIKSKTLENKVLNLKTTDNISFESTEAALITQSYYYISKHDFKNASVIQKKLTELYDLFPEQIALHHANYLSSLYNLMVSNLILNKYNIVENILIQIDAYHLKQNNRLVNLKLFNYLNIGLAFYNKQGNFIKSSSYETTISQGLTKFNASVHIFAKVSLQLHLIVSFIGIRNFNSAIFWTNNLLNELHSKSISTHLLIAKILSIIIAFEQKKYSYLSFIAKQFEDELNGIDNCLNSFKSIAIFFSSCNFNDLTKSDLKKKLTTLKTELALIFNDEIETVIFDVFDITSWIDSQIFNQSFGYLVQLKFKLEDKSLTSK